jgi:glycosyltransferase involved in cell wall biosynthesis
MISIVIPTRNSSATLAACLDSIKAQGYDDYEVIVVDSMSRDSTKDIANSAGALLLSFEGPPPAARNFGFSKARGDIFLSIDSDMVLGPGLLKEISDKLKKPGALVIPEKGHGKGFISECKKIEKESYLDSDVEAARAFSSGLFQQAGGYSEGVHFGEDWDLHDRLAGKCSIGRTSSAILHDTSGLSIISLMRKSYTYGKSLPRYLRRNGSGRFIRTRKSFIVACLSNLSSKPLHSLGLFIIKMLEYAAGATGFVIGKLKVG